MFKQRTYLAYLALARLAVGYHFTIVGWAKVRRGFDADDLKRFLDNLSNDPGDRSASTIGSIENFRGPGFSEDVRAS